LKILSALKIGHEKYPVLTGVRAVGASIVFFDHFRLSTDTHITINVMAFFFALSGFLIFRIYYEQADLNNKWLTKYFINRYARIYPVYFLLLTVAVCLQSEFRPWDLFTNYTLTHALFHGTKIIIQPSWSLTVEECFYFLAPLLMILTRTRNFLVAFALGCLLLVAALIISTQGIAFLGTPAFVLNTTFFGHFVEFFAGAFVALAVMKLEKKGGIQTSGCRFTVAGVAGVLLLVAAMTRIYGHAPLNLRAIILINNFLIPFPIGLLYWGFLRERTILSRILSSKFFGLLGRSSYAFYLLHTLIIDYISVPFLDSAPAYRTICGILTFLATWYISILLFLFYEEPVNLFIRNKFLSNTKQVGLQATLFR
jgi:peptidoglycan/LPS O-acetylase OafA/YrhL